MDIAKKNERGGSAPACREFESSGWQKKNWETKNKIG
jgi:hypothetical protein